MKNQHRSVICFIFLLWGLLLVEGLIKEWRPRDTDWQNPINWQGGRLPCIKSDVLLPEEVVVSIYLNGTVGWKSLAMPQTGELVLDDVELELGDERATAAAADCQGGEVHFTNWKPSSWFDPLLWRLSDPDGSLLDQPYLAVPHAERIPCEKDSVHLSDRHSLSVDFDRIQSLTVGQLKYGDKYLTSEEWRDRLAGQEWIYQVHHPPRSAYVNGTECSNPAGCQCGNLHVNVMQLVCSNAGSLCSDYPLECSDGIRPPGHCCDLCGSVMKLTVDESVFSQSSLDRLVTSMKMEGRIQTYSYRTEVNALHLIVADNTTNERSAQLADQILDYLTKDRANANLYGVKSVELRHSGRSWPAAHHLSPEELRLITSNVLTALGIVAVVAVMGAAYFYYNKSRLGTSREDLVSFARFQNDPASGNVEIGIEPLGGGSGGGGRVMEETAASVHLEVPQQKTSSSPSSVTDAYAEEPVIPVFPEPTGSRGDERPLVTSSSSSPSWIKRKLTRTFVNPLFGDPSARHRLSGRWTMSSLLMKSGGSDGIGGASGGSTRENPIFDIRPPSPTPPQPSPPPTSPADDEAAEDGSSSSSVSSAGATTPPDQQHPEGTAAAPEIITTGTTTGPPPLSDTPAGHAIFLDESGNEDDAADESSGSEGNVAVGGEADVALPTPLNSRPGGPEEAASGVGEASAARSSSDDAPPIMEAASSGRRTGGRGGKSIKKLWRKATRKLSPAAAGTTTTASQRPDESGATPGPAGQHQLHHQHAQRSEDQVQLTLAEETDDD